ncbi:hypothetical protein GCM10020331_018220 [Ectobacillus funiculus]
MPPLVIENLTNKFKNLQGICRASLDDLDEVEGIGEVRAKKNTRRSETDSRASVYEPAQLIM